MITWPTSHDHPGDEVAQNQYFAIVSTRVPVTATPFPFLFRIDRHGHTSYSKHSQQDIIREHVD